MGGSSSKLVTDPSYLAGKKFDYVIIGGGTAGCVLANRLSEDPSNSVLLIEAGKTNAGVLFSQIPLAFPKLFKYVYAHFFLDFVWGFIGTLACSHTVTQSSAATSPTRDRCHRNLDEAPISPAV